jgi:20S proteasome subunit beta 4
LRKGPFQTNVILAGHDNDGASLYWCDYLAALSKVPFGAHGYAANFIISIFDRDWREGMNLEEGLDLVKRCIHELHTRFLISQPKFIIKLVDANGIRLLEI